MTGRLTSYRRRPGSRLTKDDTAHDHTIRSNRRVHPRRRRRGASGVSSWSVRLRASEADHHAVRGNTASRTREFVIQDSLGYVINREARSFAQELAGELRQRGIGIGQWAVLLFLWARDGMSQAELARVVAIEPPTMVRTIDRMVRDGLVTRAPDPEDRRISRIHLTDRGRALRDELVPKAAAVNEANLARLTKSEGRTLYRLLAKLIADR
jgi:DNA-binding MarR family transcriptional regulator